MLCAIWLLWFMLFITHCGHCDRGDFEHTLVVYSTQQRDTQALLRIITLHNYVFKANVGDDSVHRMEHVYY